MAGEWKAFTFGDGPIEVIDGDRGLNYPKQQDFSQTGYCLFLNAGNVTATGFNFSDCAFISAEKDSLLRKGKLQKYDTVLTTRGTVGNVAYLDESVPYSHIRINSGMVILRALDKELYPRFLYYFVRSALFVSQVQSLRTGSAQPQLPIRDINRIKISAPPLTEQQAIACILGALDDKIELNQRMNETLEAIAQAIFKSWFVDAVNNGLPEGWREISMLDFANLLSGGTPKTDVSEYWDGDIPWVSAKDVTNARNSFVLSTERQITQTGVENSATQILPALTTIITARGTVGNHCLLGRQMAMNQTNYGLTPKDKRSHYFLFFTVSHLIDELKQQAYGTIFDTITTRTFQYTNIVRPPEPEIERFESTAGSFMNKVLTNLQQSAALAALRDVLLPKLISGELRVPDAERIVGRCA